MPQQTEQTSEDAGEKEAPGSEVETKGVAGFVDGMTKIQRGRTEKVLNERFNYADGGVMTRAERVERVVAGGAVFGKHVGNKGKVVFAINQADGSYVPITKTEYDYAAYLGGKMAPESDYEQEVARARRAELSSKYDYPTLEYIAQMLTRHERALRATNPNGKEGKRIAKEIEELKELQALKEAEDAPQPTADTDAPITPVEETGSDPVGSEEALAEDMPAYHALSAESRARVRKAHELGEAIDEADERRDIDGAVDARVALKKALNELSDAELDAAGELADWAEHESYGLHREVDSMREARAEVKSLSDAANEHVERLSATQAVEPVEKKQGKLNVDAFADKNEMRPVMNGVYHDAEGFGVVSDGLVLLVSKDLYDKKYKGKTVLTHKMGGKAKGSTLEDKYLNWRGVLGSQGSQGKTATVDYEALSAFVNGVEAKLKARWQERKEKGGKVGSFNSWSDTAEIYLRMPDGEVLAMRFEGLKRFVAGAQHLGAVSLEWQSRDKLITARSDKGAVLAAPMRYDVDYLRYGDESKSFAYDLKGAEYEGAQLQKVDGVAQRKGNSDKTLMGVHNISEEKLRKAIKQGGLANPSMAVIDTRNGMHSDYGAISLIPRASMIDSKTGRNAGTYAGDAWTPTYPHVEKRMSDKGRDSYYKDVNGVSENRSLTGELKMAWDNYLEGRGSDKLAYWFLKERGVEPEQVVFDSGYSEEQRSRFAELTDYGRKKFSEMTEEERGGVLALLAESKGMSVSELLAKYEAMRARNEELLGRDDVTPFRKGVLTRQNDEINKYGITLSPVSDFLYGMKQALVSDGKLDVSGTLTKSRDKIQEEGLQADFNRWLESKEQKYGVREMLFDGLPDERTHEWLSCREGQEERGSYAVDWW